MSIELSKRYTMAADRHGATESVITAYDRHPSKRALHRDVGYTDTRNIIRESASVAVKVQFFFDLV